MTSASAPSSLTTCTSPGAGPASSLTRAAASSAVAPLDEAMATATARADNRSDGSITFTAAYVRPVSSLTAAPCADPVRARADRASVMIFRSSGPNSPSSTRASLPAGPREGPGRPRQPATRQTCPSHWARVAGVSSAGVIRPGRSSSSRAGFRDHDPGHDHGNLRSSGRGQWSVIMPAAMITETSPCRSPADSHPTRHNPHHPPPLPQVHPPALASDKPAGSFMRPRPGTIRHTRHCDRIRNMSTSAAESPARAPARKRRGTSLPRST